MMDARRKNVFSVSFSQFGNAFSSNFVQIFFPFYILKISTYPVQYTLLWTGAIMGAASLCAAITSPFWGSLTHRFSPKLLYLRSLMVNVVSFFLMGFTTDLHLLFILRVIQGLAAGTSTIGLIIVSSSSPKERISSDIGLFQSSITLGQLLGSPARQSRGSDLWLQGGVYRCFVCRLFILRLRLSLRHECPSSAKNGNVVGKGHLDKRILIGGFLCFTAMVQMRFLPSVLPNVFEAFQYEHATALKLAGTVVLCYTVTAMIGTYVWSRLSRRIGIYRMITLLFVLGILLAVDARLQPGGHRFYDRADASNRVRGSHVPARHIHLCEWIEREYDRFPERNPVRRQCARTDARHLHLGVYKPYNRLLFHQRDHPPRLSGIQSLF